MGAWGEKAFQNDSALDWLAELQAAGVELLRDTLSRVAETHADELVDVDDGAAAIAAAEIVAAALGRGRERLPAEACEWLDVNQGIIALDELGLANRAAQRVLGHNSELRALWDEGGADNAWLADVHALLQKLGGDAEATRPEGSNEATSPRHVGKHEKQALIAFLGARGLTVGATQLARIQWSTDLAEIRRWLARAPEITSVEALFD
jgi:hypothetical protein